MSGNLFEEQKSSNPLFKIFAVIGAIVLVIAAIVGVFAYRSNQERLKAAREVKTEADLRDTAVMLLAFSRFSGDEFRQQILGKGRLERLDRVNQELYFTYPQAPQEEFDEFIGKFFLDKTKLDMAQESGGRMRLGNYSVGLENAPFFFRTKPDNFKIDSSQTLTFAYQTVNYSFSMREAKGFLDGSQVYGGNLYADATQRTTDTMLLFANHGIMVAKPGEPSLQRLVGDLLKDVPDNRESKIQRLVDFVSNEIEYSYTEALSGGETLKRPNEILATRNGDCSNKTILLASLLEQINEDYIMLYCPKHITVAVPQGNFANDNKMDFGWEQKNWLIAESTAPGFQVGKTVLKDFIKITPVNFVQRPKEKNIIFDASSLKVLEFR